MKKLLRIIPGILLFAAPALSNAQCVIFSETFDASLGAFTSNVTGAGSWTQSTACAQSNTPNHSGPGTAIFSGAGGCFYDNPGLAAYGSMQSAPIVIPSTGSYGLTFNYFVENECGLSGTCTYDVLSVEISTDGGTIWTTEGSTDNDMQIGGWQEWTIDMAAYAGETIIIRFTFDTGDEYSNDFDGIYVDDVQIRKMSYSNTIIPNGPLEFCQGGSVVLISSGPNDNYWSTGDSTQFITVTTTGIYTLSTIEGPGCIPSVQSVYVDVNPAGPAPSAWDTTVCAGSSFTIPTMVSPAEGGQFQWFSSLADTSADHTGDVLPAQAYDSTTTWYVEFRDSLTAGDTYYLTSINGEPWAYNDNIDAMNTAFDTSWTMIYFENVLLDTILPSAGFIFVDGSDASNQIFESFVTANISDLESWVNGGGHLFLNCAPNSAGNINVGFGGTVLYYPGAADNVSASNPLHAIFNTPSPVALAYSGNSFAHANIQDPSYIPLIHNDFDTTQVVLGYKQWGAGIIMVGGMTVPNYHLPHPDAYTLRSNILTFMDNSGPGGLNECPSTRTELVVNVVKASYEQDITICSNQQVTLAGGIPAGGTYAQNGVPLTVFDGSTFAVGTYPVVYTVTSGGCTVSDTAMITVSGCVGLNDEENGTVSIYPNPSEGFVSIETSGIDANRIELVSVTGETILSVKASSEKSLINGSYLASGVYFVRIHHAKGIVNRRIVIR